MATTNYKLPTITGNMTADVVRDMNALAEATDGAIKKVVDGVDLSTVTQQIGAVDQRVTTHLADSVAHPKYAINTSSTDSYSITLDGVTEYKEGMIVSFKATVANTTTCSLNINGLGAKTIYKYTTAAVALETGDIVANQIVTVIYNGTYFIVLGNQANGTTAHSVQTLTNKTLTTPKFANGGYIADPSGNEQIKFAQTTSAVNEFTVKNASTGNSPELQATGNDANIDINLVPKGTGDVKIKGKQVALQESLDTHSADNVQNADGVHGLKVESGVWTPTLDTVGVAYSTQLGTYTRIGNKVFVEADLIITSKGTSSDKLNIAGLPFIRSGQTLPLMRLITAGLVDSTKKINGLVGGNKVALYFENNAELTTGTYQLTIGDITNNTRFILSGFYTI